MKRTFKVTAILMFIILTVTAFAIPVGAKQVFSDLDPEHWCYSKIMDFEEKGYVCGYEDGTFRADRTITRAEYVKIVNNFFGYKPSEKKTSLFVDVNSGDWFMPYVNEAVDRGYIEGFEDGTFRPHDPIRRQEATVILARILKIDKEVYPADHKDGLAQYPDGYEVQEWARVAIHSYSVYNFINGYEDGTLRILRNVTRAETVELLHILEQKIIIDKKPGGGGSVVTPTLKPTIDVLKRVSSEKEFIPNLDGVVVNSLNDSNTSYAATGPIEEFEMVKLTKSGWVNKENSSQEGNFDGAFVNITSQTAGATIHETVDVPNTQREYVTTKRNEYTNKFFLSDGLYVVSAQAKKTGRKDSDMISGEIKIDTVAPVVHARANSRSGEVKHEQSITVSINDPNLYGVNVISGLDKVAYAWFDAQTEERVSVWKAFELSDGQATILAPREFGSYKLGISAIDVAENNFGTITEYNVPSDDISGDVPVNPSGDIKYDFVKDLANGEEENPDKNPTGEDIIVIVGNNAPSINDLVMYTKVNVLVSGELIATDDDNDELTYTIEENLTSGDATINGAVTSYVSSKFGVFTYKVKVSDNYGGEDIANVTVYVCDVEVKLPEAPSGDEVKDPQNPGSPVNPDLSGDKLIIFVGEEENMTAQIIPSGDEFEDAEYEWSLAEGQDKAKIVTGQDEKDVKVKGINPGETTIKVKVDINSGDTTITIEKEIPVIVLSKITIQIPSISKNYDATPLKAENFDVKKDSTNLKNGVIASGDKVSVVVYGERTEVGTSDAEFVSYEIKNKNNEDVRKYYVPTFINGTLEIIDAIKPQLNITMATSKTKDLKDEFNGDFIYTSGEDNTFWYIIKVENVKKDSYPKKVSGEIKDKLPASLEYVSGETESGTITSNGDTIIWNAEDIGYGDDAQYAYIKVRVKKEAFNTFMVSGDKLPNAVSNVTAIDAGYTDYEGQEDTTGINVSIFLRFAGKTRGDDGYLFAGNTTATNIAVNDLPNFNDSKFVVNRMTGNQYSNDEIDNILGGTDSDKKSSMFDDFYVGQDAITKYVSAVPDVKDFIEVNYGGKVKFTENYIILWYKFVNQQELARTRNYKIKNNVENVEYGPYAFETNADTYHLDGIVVDVRTLNIIPDGTKFDISNTAKLKSDDVNYKNSQATCNVTIHYNEKKSEEVTINLMSLNLEDDENQPIVPENNNTIVSGETSNGAINNIVSGETNSTENISGDVPNNTVSGDIPNVPTDNVTSGDTTNVIEDNTTSGDKASEENKIGSGDSNTAKVENKSESLSGDTNSKVIDESDKKVSKEETLFNEVPQNDISIEPKKDDEDSSEEIKE